MAMQDIFQNDGWTDSSKIKDTTWETIETKVSAESFSVFEVSDTENMKAFVEALKTEAISEKDGAEEDGDLITKQTILDYFEWTSTDTNSWVLDVLRNAFIWDNFNIDSLDTQWIKNLQFLISLTHIYRNLKDWQDITAGFNREEDGWRRILDGIMWPRTRADILSIINWEKTTNFSSAIFSWDEDFTKLNQSIFESEPPAETDPTAVLTTAINSFNTKFAEAVSEVQTIENFWTINSIADDWSKKTIKFAKNKDDWTAWAEQTYIIESNTVKIWDEVYPPTVENFKFTDDITYKDSDWTTDLTILKEKKLSELGVSFSIQSWNPTFEWTDETLKTALGISWDVTVEWADKTKFDNAKTAIETELTTKLTEMIQKMAEISENLNAMSGAEETTIAEPTLALSGFNTQQLSSFTNVSEYTTLSESESIDLQNINIDGKNYTFKKTTTGVEWWSKTVKYEISWDGKNYTSEDWTTWMDGENPVDESTAQTIQKVLAEAEKEQYKINVEAYLEPTNWPWKTQANEFKDKLDENESNNILKNLEKWIFDFANGLNTESLYSDWAKKWLLWILTTSNSNWYFWDKLEIMPEQDNLKIKISWIKINENDDEEEFEITIPRADAYIQNWETYNFDETALQKAINSKLEEEIKNKDLEKFREDVKKWYESFGTNILNTSNALTLYDFQQAWVEDLTKLASFFNLTGVDTWNITENNKWEWFGLYDVENNVDYNSGMKDPDPTKRAIIYELDVDEVLIDSDKTDISILLPIKDKDWKPVLPWITKDWILVPVSSSNREEWKSTEQWKAFLKMLWTKILSNSPTTVNSDNEDEFAKIW